jgi:hypothetical protein
VPAGTPGREEVGVKLLGSIPKLSK